MEEFEGSARGVSLRAAACMLAGDARDPVSGRRVRRAVDTQLRRAGVASQDDGDVRTEVVLALLAAPAPDLPLPLELVCARAAAIARNKAIDHGRRLARRPLVFGSEPPEPTPPGTRPGSLADGLDEVAALAHRRRVRSDLVRALAKLDAPQRAAIGAHAEGGAARAAGLPRSTYYRALAHARTRLRSDLRGRLAGAAALGAGALRWMRDLFAHVEAAHAVAAATAAVAVTAAVALSLPGGDAHKARPLPLRAVGGRVAPAPPAAPARPARHRRSAAPALAPATRSATAKPVAAAPVRRAKTPCIYDPSTYDC